MAEGLGAGRVAVVGAGAMGEALVAGLLASGVDAAQVAAADPEPARRRRVSEAHGVRCVEDAATLVPEAEAMVLAVKPDRVVAVLEALAPLGAEALRRPLWISIAAGVPLARLEAALPPGARVVRAMPNTPALVGAGATAFVAGASATADDRTVARALFEGVGTVWECPSEGLLDAVTGLSGSGPAYVFVLLEALSDAAVRMGLPREAATHLAAQTALGAARLVLETGEHPATLKDRVTSPGGTTIAGLERLEAGGFRAAIHAAVEAATRRSRELGSGSG